MANLTVNVALTDDIAFESKAEQDQLAQAIDQETFVAPDFVGVRKKTANQVTVRTQINSLQTGNAETIGEIVADHFDTSVDWVQIEQNR